MSIYLRLGSLLLAFLAIGTEARAEETVWLHAGWSFQDTDKTLKGIRHVIRVDFRKAAGHDAGIVPRRILRGDSPAASDPRYWQLNAIKDGKSETIPLTIAYDTAVPEPALKYLILVPAREPSSKLDYKLALKTAPGLPFPLRLVPGYRLANPDVAISLPLRKEDLQENESFKSANKAYTSGVTLNTGEGHGVSARMEWGRQDFEVGRQSSFHSILTLDGTYRPKEKGRYLNSVVGEIDASLNYTWDAPALRANGVQMFSLTHRLESDQDFDLVNGTVGVTSWTSFGADWIDNFSRALCVIGEPPQRTASPILALAYDYVFKIHEDLATGERVREVGEHRLRGQFYWSVKLIHGMELPIVKGKYDADFVANVSGIYDIESSSLLPDVRLSLEFAPENEDSNSPSFTLTYVNGKVTPRFENYDAILAGFKLPF